jgi:hypothetical protein
MEKHLGIIIITYNDFREYVVWMFEGLDNLIMSTIVAITIEIPS